MQSDYDNALKYYHKGYEIVRKLDDKRAMASSLNNIGIIYDYNGKFEKALEYYQKALSIIEKLGDRKKIVAAYNNIGVVHYYQGNYSKSLEYYHKSLELEKQLGDKKGIAETLGNIGNLYLFLSGEDVELKIEPNEYVDLNKSINLKKSIKYLLESISIFEEVGEIAYRSTNYLNLSKAYAQTKDFESAFLSYQKHKLFHDSAYSVKSAKKIAKFESMRQEAENEKEIALIKQRESSHKNEKQIIIYSAIALVLVTFFFVVLIYRRLKKEKNLTIELDLKNKKIEDTNIELETQQKQLEDTHYKLVDKNDEVLSSIRYAKTIQSAMLPWESTLQDYLKKYFLIFKPKDIVSGDFYWFQALENDYLLAVADCTGHGVPGSMLSMMGSSILDEAVLSRGLKDTSEILSHLNKKMIESLNKQEEENSSRDGMDICLIKVSNESIQFSGAKRPIFIYKNSILETINRDRNSIAGEEHIDDDYIFKSTEIKLDKGSKVFLTSDGFVDQIGTNGKKFGTKRFKELVSQNLSINELNRALNKEFENHVGNEEQRDDITILGLEI